MKHNTRLWCYVHIAHISHACPHIEHTCMWCVCHTHVWDTYVWLYMRTSHTCVALYVCGMGVICMWYVCDILIYTHACGFIYMFVCLYSLFRWIGSSSKHMCGSIYSCVWLYMRMSHTYHTHITHTSHTHHTHITHISYTCPHIQHTYLLTIIPRAYMHT